MHETKKNKESWEYLDDLVVFRYIYLCRVYFVLRCTKPTKLNIHSLCLSGHRLFFSRSQEYV